MTWDEMRCHSEDTDKYFNGLQTGSENMLGSFRQEMHINSQ